MKTPFDWVEPPLPHDLPPGEAKREWPFEVWGRPATYPPHTAPGFQRAYRAGMLPPPAPAYPPPPLPGPSAHRLLWAAMALCFGSVAMLGALADRTVMPAVVVCVPLFLAGGYVFVRALPRREQAEFAAGYTSRSVYPGLWRLAADGRVLREPDRTVPPPGWYPSPYYVGLLQRWEGPGWKPLPQRWWRHPEQYFQVPDRPFLD